MKRVFLLLIACFASMIMSAQMHWTPIDEGLYSGSTTVIAVVQINGVEQTSDQIEVAVFSGNECRGTALTGVFPITGRYIAQVNVYGENGHQLTFKAYDHATNQEMENDPEVTVQFTEDGSGTLFAPLELNFVTEAVTTNTTPGDWNDPTIWGGTVPDENAVVELGANCTIGDNGDVTVTVAELTIPTGVTMTIESGSTIIVTGNMVCDDKDGLVIEEGAQVINESPNVKATVEKDVIAYTAKDTDGWYLISSSVNEMPIEGSDFIVPTYDLYRYFESGSNSMWQNYKAGHADFTTFENGRGYLYANSNSFTPVFAGDLNYEDIVRPVTCTGSDPLSGFNVIGNPFPHNIYKGAGGAIDDASLSAGYYTLSFNGEWETNTFDDPILPEQGIMVKTTASKDLTIAKTTNAATSETTAKDVLSRLKFTVNGIKGEDRAYAYFGEGIGLDKIDHLSDVIPMIYIVNGDGEFAIAMMNEETEQFNIHFKAKITGRYTLHVDIDGDFSYLHLIDRQTGNEMDLLLGDDYDFMASPQDDSNRFIVSLRNVTGIDENVETPQFAYVSDGDVIVSGEGTMQIVDMTGRVAKTMEISGVETVCKPSPGFYIVRIVNGTDVKTQKIVVR